ncbi:dehydrogenase [Desulfosporosinus fructosivorans]|uniref:Dehydrogenase n=1 Tax=Desulfosporosinus fructosivorans TaxID=2018669 RepID=A0A4Z0R882_9FIRM|nr:molecular chaperone TorD family protein [Desulfosporosinus fructosivorans]TGE39342.1 dehydrogenase [Desulfosporosinus fructosivorans]
MLTNDRIETVEHPNLSHETQLRGLAKIRPLLEARIFAYDILRRSFLEEPSHEFLKLLSKDNLIGSFPFSEEEGEIQEGIRQVHSDLMQYESVGETIYNRLHWDYTRLFIGPYELQAPAWESAYLNKERLLFQEETLKVRLAYLKYAFLPKHFQHEADDHLGLELDFMYKLSVMVLEKYEKNEHELLDILENQKRFLQEHLLRWVPEFQQNVCQHSDTEFYRGMSRILHGFLRLDLEALAELLDIEGIGLKTN